MKKYSIICVVILMIIACNSQKKVVYDFPPAMSAAIQSQFTEQCEKGRFLYSKNCARCHNTIVKGKTIIPDFSEEKLVGYAIRNSNRKHEANMPDTLVTAEELGLIMTFLTYKKKNELSKN